MRQLIQINEFSKTPKYLQIINCIVTGIEKGELKVKDKLPSVNKLLIQFDISRDTVVKAYEQLKEMSLIESAPGKGYYVKSNQVNRKAKIFLLFNKLSVHKKIIYDAFSSVLGDQAAIDFFIYNNNYRLFKNLIQENTQSNYTHYVIIAHFLDGGENATEILNQIPKNKLILLDKFVPGITGDYAAVYQDFAKDIYNALAEALSLLKKYSRLNLIFPPYSYHPLEIVNGFRNFCTEYAFDHNLISDISTAPIGKDQVYINLMEDDLVILIKRVKSLGLRVGRDVGIISYNETPLKEILLDGITVISTDFKMLGETAARMVLENGKDHVVNPFRLVVRNSL
ncbi:MAG TPA: GntR family transcriptional regulator [Flavilitoribacter sp.]|nr:GntR family transcriptional regulator [Flavilitoribacter sp.]HMQ90088.1 GntR family transcriptional regulator [Flavilitoribacter sp.]